MRDHTVIVLAMYKYKTEDQGWKFFLLLLRSSLFCSKLTRRSLQNSESLKKIHIFHIFWSVSPLFMPTAKCSHHSLLICSFLKSHLSDSLPSLFTKERPWAICSGCPWQKSNGSDSLFFTSKSLFCSQKTSKFAQVALYKRVNCSINSYFSNFCCQFSGPFYAQQRIAPVAHSLFFKEPLEGFALVALYKRATVSDSLRLLMTKEQQSDLLFFTRELLFWSQKTSKSLEKLTSEFPTLLKTQHFAQMLSR